MSVIQTTILQEDINKLQQLKKFEVVTDVEMEKYILDNLSKSVEIGESPVADMLTYKMIAIIDPATAIPTGTHIFVKDLEKAKGGIYKLTAQNKKLGRVGARYGEQTGGLTAEIRHETNKEKENIITDPKVILEATKHINSLKEKRNRSAKGSPTYSKLVEKITELESRKVLDKDGNITGWKKK